MKKCSACGIEKVVSDFQKRLASKDSLTSACRLCLVDRDAKRYEREKEIRLSRMKSYTATEAGKAAHYKATSEWRRRNKIRHAAHLILNNAVKAGTVHKWPVCALPECSFPPEAHHADYNNPLGVVWLCDKHHKETHKLAKEIKRTQ